MIIGEALGIIMPIIITDHMINMDIQSPTPQGIGTPGFIAPIPMLFFMLEDISMSDMPLDMYTR